MHLLLGRAPTLQQYIIGTASNVQQARQAISLFAQSALRPELRSLSLIDTLTAIEQAVVTHSNSFAGAAAATGANALTIVNSVLSEHVAIEASSSRHTPMSLVQPDTDTVSDNAYQRALLEQRFRAFALTASGINTDTSAGRRSLLLEAFGSGTAICAKQLFTNSVALSKRHVILGRLKDARDELPGYLGWVMVVNPATQIVPPALLEWTWSGTDGLDTAMMDQFLARRYPTIDWFNGPNGINALVAWRRSQKDQISYSDPLNFYCLVSNVKKLSEFAHALFRGIGAADVLASATLGFTMKTWCEFYIEHIEMAHELASLEEQVSWLEDASIQFVLWWGEVAATVSRFVNSSEPDKAKLTALTTSDCAPAEHLRKKQVSKGRLDESRQAFNWVASSGRERPPDPDKLPLLSDHRELVKTYRPSVETPVGCKPSKKLKSKGRDLDEKPNAQAPGSAVHLWVWLTANASLLYAKLVWDITQICADFGISDPGAYCWPVLVTRKSVNNCLAVCDKHEDAAHKHATQGAHKRIQGFDPNDQAIIAKYSRAATAEELAKLPNAPAANQGAPGGRGITKARGRGRGRSGGRRGGPSFRGRA